LVAGPGIREPVVEVGKLCAPHGSQDDWKLVLFIRHLPQLTMEERVEMERDNPKRHH